MSKHTPGPWIIEGGEYVGVSIHAGEKDKWGVYAHDICVLDDAEYIENRNPHDARLIAAAPDLLEVAQKIVNNWGNLHHKDLMQARAAIAKAKGEA